MLNGFSDWPSDALVVPHAAHGVPVRLDHGQLRVVIAHGHQVHCTGPIGPGLLREPEIRLIAEMVEMVYERAPPGERGEAQRVVVVVIPARRGFYLPCPPPECCPIRLRSSRANHQDRYPVSEHRRGPPQDSL